MVMKFKVEVLRRLLCYSLEMLDMRATAQPCANHFWILAF